MTSQQQRGDASALRSWWWYLLVVLKRRKLIVLGSVGFGLLVGVLTFVQPRQYTAIGSFILVRSQPASAAISSLTAQFGLAAPVGGGQDSPEFYSDLIRSRSLLRDVVSREFVVGGESPFRGSLISFFGIDESNPRALEEAAHELDDRITVTVDFQSGLVRFEVDLPDQELSGRVGALLLQRAQEYNLRYQREDAAAERAFVEQRLEDQRRELQALEDSLARFYDRNRQVLRRSALAPDLLAEEQRRQRQVTLAQQLYLVLAQTYEEAKMKEARNTPLLTVVDDPSRIVVPKPRGTIRNTILAALVAGLFLVIWSFVLEYAASSAKDPDYQKLRNIWRGIMPGSGKLG